MSAGGRPGKQTLPSRESSRLSPLSAGQGAPSCQSPPYPLPEGAGALFPVSTAGQPLRGWGEFRVPILYPGSLGSAPCLPPLLASVSLLVPQVKAPWPRCSGFLGAPSPLPPSSLTQALHCASRFTPTGLPSSRSGLFKCQLLREAHHPRCTHPHSMWTGTPPGSGPRSFSPRVLYPPDIV